MEGQVFFTKCHLYNEKINKVQITAIVSVHLKVAIFSDQAVFRTSPTAIRGLLVAEVYSQRPEMLGCSTPEQRVLWESVALRKPFISICRDHLAQLFLILRLGFRMPPDVWRSAQMSNGTPKPHSIPAHSHACPSQLHTRALRTKRCFIVRHASIHMNIHVYVWTHFFNFTAPSIWKIQRKEQEEHWLDI